MLYLEMNEIPLNEYKTEPNVYYFDNPFKNNDDDKKVYRNVVFDNEQARDSAKYEFINISHPFTSKIRKKIKKQQYLGISSAFKIRLNKFEGTKGLLFYYVFSVTNNIDKKYKKLIPIFLTNEETYNSRISNIFNDFEYYPTIIIQNFNFSSNNIINPTTNAFKYATEISQHIYYNKKTEWTKDLDNYRVKLEQFYKQKEQSILDIQIENIKKSKLIKLKKEKEKEMGFIKTKKNIVPLLELLQTAYVEIISK